MQIAVRTGFGRYIAPVTDFLIAVVGWTCIAPLTFLVPRDKALAVFFGRDGGRYTDNCKHLFASLHSARDLPVRAVFLVTGHALERELRALGASSVRVRSLAAAWLWLRAGTIVVDSIDWSRSIRYPASRGARIVQLWHGVPLKYVQLALIAPRLERLNRGWSAAIRLQRAITGRFAKSTVFLSTSPFVTERAFAKSFRFKHVSHAGYPRNDVLFGTGSPLAELGIDADASQAVQAHRSDSNAKVGLYAPTFRSGFEDPFAQPMNELHVLSEVASRWGMLILIKLHPWMYGRAAARKLPGLRFVAPESDVYPLMRSVDFLVTDYSSIYFDFLLLDRPILFFPHDLDRYLSSERPMYFSYESITPGAKATDALSLGAELEKIAAGIDEWTDERRRVRDLVFLHQDGNAGRRLCEELFLDTGAHTV